METAMINSYKDYKNTCYCDSVMNKYSNLSLMRRIRYTIFPEPNYTFIKWLRRYEYLTNCKSIVFRFLRLFVYARYRYLSHKTGLSIPKNVFDKGLSIPHFGNIVVNPNAKIGKNCMIHVGVNIGANAGSYHAPIIGDNVFIGPGAKIYGHIQIADNCYIGANSVVNTSFLEPFSVIVGMPAQKVKIDSKTWWQKNRIIGDF